MAHQLGRKMSFLLGTCMQSSWTSSTATVISTSVHRCRFPCSFIPMLSFQRFSTAKAGECSHDPDDQGLDFPGGKVSFSAEMRFLSGTPEERISCYRVLDDYGHIISGSSFQQMNKEVALKIYQDMATLQTMDIIFYEAQRQGRISFYLTSIGEEAINIASAAALTMDDIVLPQVRDQIRALISSSLFLLTCLMHSFSLCATLEIIKYREPGVLLWRGFTLQEFANHNFGNKSDYGKGRQMPIHYGCKRLNYFTISSPISTQLPQAVGVAYSLKMDRKNACAITYFGDGATSEGDFHAALNFAAVLEAPVIFFCRNNGWAISTPTTEQFRSDGAVIKGQAYGIQSIRVDGNDALAVYNAVCAAREMVISECRPVLVEALTYRVGHHSTSDDSTKYRPIDEIEHWRTARDPVSRYRKWIETNGWWNDEVEDNLRSNVKKELLKAIQIAERLEKPAIDELFTDVYDKSPSNLREQEKSLREMIKKHPEDYPSDVPI